MIEKFTLDENIDSEDELLCYVYDLGVYLCQDWDFDNGKPTRIYSERFIYTFKSRYNENQLNYPFNYDDYNSNETIKETLKTLELNALSFWYLLLFVYDYAYVNCYNMIPTETPIKQVNKLVESIEGNIKEMNGIKSTFKNDIKLTLEIKGKHKVVIDNSLAISYLLYLCIQGLSTDENSTILNISTNWTYKTESNSMNIYMFAQAFLSFFKINPIKKVNKKLFIANLVYFTRLSMNENFDDDDLKGIINKYKNNKSILCDSY